MKSREKIDIAAKKRCISRTMRINGLVVQKSSKEEKLVLPSYASIALWLENLSFSLVLHISSKLWKDLVKTSTLKNYITPFPRSPRLPRSKFIKTENSKNSKILWPQRPQKGIRFFFKNYIFEISAFQGKRWGMSRLSRRNFH